MVKLEIQDASREMYPSIKEQRIEAYRVYKDKLPEDHWKALEQTLSSNSAEQEGVELIVAILNETLVGSVVLFPAKTSAYEFIDELDYPEIRMLAVSKETQGQGIASSLVKECIHRSKAKGFQAIGLHTGEFMTDAIRLYEGFGFERIPKFDFEPADDGINVRAYQLKIDEA
ncbi:GNAT family N-acetyltransferase [Alkalicoccobacillus murimartini]|uniref:Ribosomal protein S18 acetylase RimI-like enzyme n=1 Tax=Alkalicoccobacillus murimartini TaxID=171685 RepID=A0ABT9YPR5_9BACI|nr:GNAT family N-acetyltransferase [Alkalicoccobacillus murimartini]MDQ0209024.1 ribosomal protein S18 acetylase RimI-like enzyme [Alkalicoccobacillus murimartini]